MGQQGVWFPKAILIVGSLGLMGLIVWWVFQQESNWICPTCENPLQGAHWQKFCQACGASLPEAAKS